MYMYSTQWASEEEDEDEDEGLYLFQPGQPCLTKRSGIYPSPLSIAASEPSARKDAHAHCARALFLSSKNDIGKSPSCAQRQGGNFDMHYLVIHESRKGG